MQCKVLLTFLIFASSLCNAQNLVPNPSFEEHEYCPTGMTHLNNSVVDWYSWQESPDYFHSCSNELNGNAGVPANAWGYQFPITGDAYAGLFTYVHSFENGREYIACPLTESLEIGEDYYVMFYASFFNGGTLDYWHCASNRIGAKFFKDPNYTWQLWDNPYTPQNTADIQYNEMFVDTMNWKLIEGWFTADQEYNWIAIGNFFDDNHTDTLQLGYWDGCYTFYYIENVCVAKNSDDCDYLKQDSDVNSVNDQNITENAFSLYPNPSSGLFQIESSLSISSIRVYNPIGQLILNQKPGQSHATINVTSWSKGFYILEVKDAGGNHQIFKLIKQ